MATIAGYKPSFDLMDFYGQVLAMPRDRLGAYEIRESY